MEALHFNKDLTKHTKYLRSVAIKLTSNLEEADDLVQDTLYRALSNRDKFQDGNLKAWLTTIMKNMFINGLRAKKRRQGLWQASNVEINLDRDGGHTANTAESNFMLHEIEQQINALHPDLKAPFDMRRKGFRYDEIAQQLQAPLGTVKSRIHFARKCLMRNLSHLYGTKHLADLAA